MSVWNTENIVDVAESVGIGALTKDVQEHLARDVEYRISQILEEALCFMRHGKRTMLSTQDISLALRALDVEPLYGYESTRPLRFGEASIGPGQSLFYVEDEEVDFEKLINAPLPKVPREMSFTAHWLAVEGVQPSIPQNPTQADQRQQELLAKGPGANPALSAMSGADNTTVKPLVKHVLSKELQLYFDRITSAIMDERNESFKTAALASLRTDPGIHQLVPYFVQWVADKVTHHLKSTFTLTQCLLLVQALLDNPSIYMDPYIPAMVPSVLTCLIGKHIGSGKDATVHFAIRDFAASVLAKICQEYASSSATLKMRIARSCLKTFLDSHKPWGSHYGAIIGLLTVGNNDVIRSLILPHLKSYEMHLSEGLKDEVHREQAEHVLEAIIKALSHLKEDYISTSGDVSAAVRNERLLSLVGNVVGQRLLDAGDERLISVLASDEIM